MVHSSQPLIVTSKQSSYKWQVPLLLSKELHWHSSVLWHFFKHSLEVLEEPAKNYSSKGWRNCRIVDPCTLIMFQFLCVGANSFDTTSAIEGTTKNWQSNSNNETKLNIDWVHFQKMFQFRITFENCQVFHKW